MEYSIILGQSISLFLFIILINSLILPSSHKYLKPILYFYIFFCGTIVAFHTGQLGSIPQLFGCMAILSLSERPIRRWNLILFQTGWIWSVLTDYAVTIPLRLFGFDFEAIRTSNGLMALFYALHALLSLLPAGYVGRKLRRRLLPEPDFLPPSFQKMLLGGIFISSCTLLFNIIWGSYSDYPTEILLFNGILFFAFALINLLISFSLYRTMQENQRLALREQAREKLTEYTEQLESHYQEMRRFRHDYMNLLATMNGYIQNGDMDKLQDFFEQKIVPGSRLLLDKDSVIAKLSNIKVLEIKGVLYTKIVQAMNLNLNVELELVEEITRIDMNLLTLSRVLGIYLDNAMEAAAQTPEGRLRIALLQADGQVIFHIENSTLPLSVPLDALFGEGFTTKEKHAGLGLSNAASLLSGIPNASTLTSCKAGVFVQVLTIGPSSLSQEMPSA